METCLWQICQDFKKLKWRKKWWKSCTSKTYEGGLKKFIGWNGQMMKSYLLLMTFWPMGQWDLSTAEVHEPQGSLCWKINIIWSFSTRISWSVNELFSWHSYNGCWRQLSFVFWQRNSNIVTANGIVSRENSHSYQLSIFFFSGNFQHFFF